MKAEKVIWSICFLAVFGACTLLGGDDDNGPPRNIVFSAQSGGTFQIFSMREDGSGVRQLSNGEFSSTEPAWSPDGTRIAYARSTGSTAGEELWVMDADGSNKEPLVTNPRTDSPQLGNRPAWSPDGSRLAFTSNRNNSDQSGDVYIFSLDTGEILRITTTGNAGRQLWPKKDKIIYWANKHLYQVSLVDSTKKIIDTDFSSEIGFRPLDISPGGVSILLHTFNLEKPREDQSLEKLNLSNSETVEIIKYSEFNGADWFTDN